MKPDNRSQEIVITDSDYITIDEWYGKTYTCVLCKKEIMEDFNYCPECGAKVIFNLKEN